MDYWMTILMVGGIGLVLMFLIGILVTSIINVYYDRKEKFYEKILIIGGATIKAITGWQPPEQEQDTKGDTP